MATIIARLKANAAELAGPTPSTDCSHCGRTSYWCECATRCPWNI